MTLKRKKRKKKEKNPAFSNDQPLFTIKLNIKKLLKTVISYRLSNQGMRFFFFFRSNPNQQWDLSNPYSHWLAYVKVGLTRSLANGLCSWIPLISKHMDQDEESMILMPNHEYMSTTLPMAYKAKMHTRSLTTLGSSWRLSFWRGQQCGNSGTFLAGSLVKWGLYVGPIKCRLKPLIIHTLALVNWQWCKFDPHLLVAHCWKHHKGSFYFIFIFSFYWSV